MKKIITILVGVVMIGAMQVSAQNPDTTKVTTTVTTTSATSATVIPGDDSKSPTDFPVMYIGFRYMPTVADFDYEPIDNNTAEAEAIIGHGFGGFIGFNLSNHFALQGEVIYSPLSQKYKSENRIDEVKITYINIPLLLRLNTGVNKPVNLNFVVGPQIGFNTGSSVDTETNDGTTAVEAKVAVKTGDVGVAYGAGLDFRLGGYTTLGIGFRGVYGLVDISDNSNNTTTDDYYVLDRAHTRTYAGYIGIAFGF